MLSQRIERALRHAVGPQTGHQPTQRGSGGGDDGFGSALDGGLAGTRTSLLGLIPRALVRLVL